MNAIKVLGLVLTGAGVAVNVVKDIIDKKEADQLLDTKVAEKVAEALSNKK